jgi:hypothetical protein
MLKTNKKCLGLGAYVFMAFSILWPFLFWVFGVAERELGILELTNTMRLILLEPSS